jgi:hypothetical protein
MSMIDDLGLTGSHLTCTFNTGTLYDYLTGDAVRGYDGKWYIRGGYGPFVSGIAGRGNTFKSTFIDGLLGRILGIYPRSEAIAVDTEGIKDAQRIITCAGRLGSQIDISRITVKSSIDYDLQTTWKKIQEIGEYKEAHRKEYTFESPFVDGLTGKRVVAWIPTLLFVDSLTEMFSADEAEMMNSKEGMDDKKIKMLWMVDGNKKTMFMRHIRKACERWGLIVVCSAHIGANTSIDSYMPPSKQLQHMKQADRFKGVGAKFEFLTRNLIIATRCSLLQVPETKDTLYGWEDGTTPDKDLNELSITLVRGKNNLSGGELPFVISQSQGLLNDVTNYQYLRSNDYFGLPGNKTTHACAFMPTVKMTRNSMRAASEKDPKVERALELCAQLLYIRHNWAVAQTFPDVLKTPEELYEQLQKKNSRVDEVLASRGYWTYDEKNEQPYYSILDVLELLKK